MINIAVFNHTNVNIESIEYNIDTQEKMITFIHDLLNKVYFSGERICLEKAKIDDNLVYYTTVDTWSSRK